jgi:pimeloyl-ACP methyl ester carboxylesterase
MPSPETLQPTTTENCSFKTADGSVLTGILVSSTKTHLPRSNYVAIFIHGLWQHKNIAFLKRFGQTIPGDPEFEGLSTFRFDVRGLGKSEGRTSFTPHFSNKEDLEAAIAFVESRGYAVHCLYGYSAGGNVSMMYAGTANKGKKIPYIVNSSARFEMDGIEDTLSEDNRTLLRETGSYTFRFTKRGRPVECVVSQQDIELFKSIDMKKYCESIPFETRVLLTHGLDDVRVPPEDSARFATSIVNMTQHLLPNCDHGYKGTEVVESLYAVFKEWYLRDAERHTERRLHAARKGKGKL